jgi:hypothetical protein
MVNVLELVLPIISGALLLGYHLFWIVELIKFPNRTTLSLVLRVKKAWVKTTVSYLPQNNVFVVQALRNGIFASNFFAFTSSAISFVLLNLSTTSSGLLKFQFLAAAGFLALTFINMGIVIRNHNNAGYLITVGRDIEEGDGGRLETLHDKAAVLLRRAQVHWNVGTTHTFSVPHSLSHTVFMVQLRTSFLNLLRQSIVGVRLFIFAFLVGAWIYSPIVLLTVTIGFIVIFYYYDHI